jgi:hypothetical protein
VQNKKERMMVPRHLYPSELLRQDKVISSVGWHHWVNMTLVGSQRPIKTCEFPPLPMVEESPLWSLT